MRTLLSPKVVIPTFVGLALIGALVGASDAGKVAAGIGRLRGSSALGFFALMVVYEAIRGVQWHVLLRALGVKVPLEAESFSFILGEATKSAPIGNYFQNYLLSRVEDEDFGRTSAVTTFIVLAEVAWCLVVLVIVPIDSWTWLRPLILGGLTVFGILVVLVSRAHESPRVPGWLLRHTWARAAAEELRRFRQGVRALLRPRPLAMQAVFSAAYLAVAATALYVAATGLGISHVGYIQVLAVYALSLASGLIVPLPMDLGVVELGGLGALVAFGVSQDLALSLMIVNRLLSIGSALVIALISLPFLRAELGAAFRSRRVNPDA